MASIKSQLALSDGMTGPLKSINKALNLVLNSFESVQRASNGAINTASITSARAELGRANRAVEELERNLQDCGEQQEKFNNRISSGTAKAGGLLSKIKGIAATYLGVKGIGAIVGLSDELTSNKARLELIVDDGGSIEELQNKIYASAQNARASYTDTMATVAKLGLVAGKAFSNNDELVKFSELVNKNFVVGGASATEQASAMYQLTQALGSGRLQGDEYRSIIENAPLLAKSIEEYMHNVQKAKGTMKDWASEGKLTADVIKAAVFRSADEVEERFARMPMTWGQVWTSMKNRAIKAMDPVLQRINEIANESGTQSAINGLINGLATIAGMAVEVFNVICSIYNFMTNNWSLLSPIIMGIVTALLLYKGAVIALTIAEGIHATVKGVLAAAQMLQTGATFAATAAQHGLNAAILACPITWIIIAIIAIIALFYAVVAAINKVTGTSVSATGIICGVFMVALAVIGNILVALWNVFADVFALIYNLVATVANFIGNVFNDPVGAVCRLFFDLADIVLSVLQALASAVDTIFGSSLSDSVQGWRDSLGSWVDTTFGKGVEVMAKMNANDMKLGRFEYGAAWDTGYNFGKGIETKLSGLANMQDTLDSIADNTALSAGSGGDTAGNTEDMTEELKYLRDVAEREVINRFTTAELKVEFYSENNINSSLDIDGIVEELGERAREALESAAEGVYV